MKCGPMVIPSLNASRHHRDGDGRVAVLLHSLLALLLLVHWLFERRVDGRTK